MSTKYDQPDDQHFYCHIHELQLSRMSSQLQAILPNLTSQNAQFDAASVQMHFQQAYL